MVTVLCKALLSGFFTVTASATSAATGRCRNIATSSPKGTSLLAVKMSQAKVRLVAEAVNTTESQFHENLTRHYSQQLSGHEAKCDNCSAAEEALVVAFRAAHGNHTSAQKLAVDLSSARIALEAERKALDQEHDAFHSKLDELNPLSPTTPDAVFEEYMGKVTELRQSAERARQIQASKEAKQKALEAAQVSYDSAAVDATDADAAVNVAQEAANADCGHLVGGATPSPRPRSSPLFPDRFIHYLDFDGTWNDLTGSSSVSQVTDSDCSTSGFVEGIREGSKGYHFQDGCQIQLDNPSHRVREWSISFWFKPDRVIDPTTARVDWIYGKPDYAGANCYTCHCLTMNRGDNHNVVLYWANLEVPTPTFKKDTWYNFFVTQTSGAQSIYVDGEKASEVQKTAVDADGQHVLRVGTYKGQVSMTFDELVIYDRGFEAEEVNRILLHDQTGVDELAGQ